MKVRFYNFSKRKNSTKLPSSSYTELSVLLKDDTSVHDPVLQISGGPNVSYNYAYIPTFDKYYFVKDYVSVANGLTDYYLSEDVMGSHVSEIAACSCRVAFCTNPYYSNITDPRIAVKTSKFINFSVGANNRNVLDSTGCYVVTTFGKHGGAGGVGTTYLMTEANVKKLSEWICDNDTVAGAIRNFFNGDLTSGILGISWIPFPLYTNSSGVTNVSTIWIGNRSSLADDSVTIDAYRLDKFLTVTNGDTFTIHKKYPKTDFRAVEPFTTGSMYLPGVGIVELSMSDLVESDTLTVSWALEYPTGNVSYAIKNESGDIIQTASACVAAQCPLGQTSVNGVGAVNAIKTAVAGAATLAAGAATGGGLAIAGAGAMLAGAAGTVLSYNQRATSIQGAIGTRYVLQNNPVYLEYAAATEDPEDSSGYIAIKGRPLGEVVTISSCNGYIECDNASVDIAGSDLERDEINAIMNSGFYFE